MPDGPADKPPKPLLHRRALILTAVGGAALVGGTKLIAKRQPSASNGVLDSEGTVDTLVVFTGALFGRVLPEFERDDLTQRIAYLLEQGGPIAQDCRRLASWVHAQSLGHGAQDFSKCTEAQCQLIIDRVMNIDWRTFSARFMARLSADERAHYRMRWSAVPQLAWIYRHAAPAWRARGYRRWPGVPGDWRESLVAVTPA